jgi:hypothetical protein
MSRAFLLSRLPLKLAKWRKEGRIMTRGQSRTTPHDGASDRYRRLLHVIDGAGDDPPLERLEAFIEALRAALGAETGSQKAGEAS